MCLFVCSVGMFVWVLVRACVCPWVGSCWFGGLFVSLSAVVRLFAYFRLFVPCVCVCLRVGLLVCVVDYSSVCSLVCLFAYLVVCLFICV